MSLKRPFRLPVILSTHKTLLAGETTDEDDSEAGVEGGAESRGEGDGDDPGEADLPGDGRS